MSGRDYIGRRIRAAMRHYEFIEYVVAWLQPAFNPFHENERGLKPRSCEKITAARSPLLGEGGVAAPSKKYREATLARRGRGGSFN